MARTPDITSQVANEIAQQCLCRQVQRASRAVARRFDEELRPLGLNNWQFTLLATLSQVAPPTVNGLAELLGMDRTTTTKNLRPLARRGLLEVRRDDEDARVRRILLTPAGHLLMADAIRHWKVANDAVGSKLGHRELDLLRASLQRIASD